MGLPDTLGGNIRHFNDVFKRDIVLAADALKNGDWEAVTAIQERIANAQITRHIANVLTSSTETMRQFVAEIESKFDVGTAMRFLKGVTSIGVGAGILTDLTAVAAFLGVSELLVAVIAICLLLYGISIALPTVWGFATAKMGFEA